MSGHGNQAPYYGVPIVNLSFANYHATLSPQWRDEDMFLESADGASATSHQDTSFRNNVDGVQTYDSDFEDGSSASQPQVLTGDGHGHPTYGTHSATQMPCALRNVPNNNARFSANHRHIHRFNDAQPTHSDAAHEIMAMQGKARTGCRCSCGCKRRYFLSQSPQRYCPGCIGQPSSRCTKYESSALPADAQTDARTQTNKHGNTKLKQTRAAQLSPARESEAPEAATAARGNYDAAAHDEDGKLSYRSGARLMQTDKKSCPTSKPTTKRTRVHEEEHEDEDEDDFPDDGAKDDGDDDWAPKRQKRTKRGGRRTAKWERED